MATHSSVLAWRIPGTGEPGGLPSMGSHRVGHDWRDLAAAAAELENSEICIRSDQISHSVMSDSLWPHESQHAMPQNHTYLYREVAQSCPTLCNPYQAPPSMGFSRQEYRNGLPFPSPGDLPNPGIKPWSPALQADAITSELPGKLFRTRRDSK